MTTQPVRVMQNGPTSNGQFNSMWWVARDGIGHTAYDVVDYDPFDDMDGRRLERVTTAYSKNSEYLHPDGTWKDHTAYFSDSEQVIRLLEAQGIEFVRKPWVACPLCGRVMLDDGCANWRCSNKSKEV